MSIDFYLISGSPYAWRVWLALEHMGLSYKLRLQSYSAGDLKRAEFRALNPRARVPVIVHEGFALYESAAILEYLEDAHPQARLRLFPEEAKARALVRRLVREADEYVAHPMETMVEQILFTPSEQADATLIAQARDRFLQEIGHFERTRSGDFLAGALGAADFTLYPLIALALRLQRKQPDLNIESAIGDGLSRWMRRIEALPYFEKTYPPHWKG